MSASDFTGNSGGIASSDDNIIPGTVLLGGSVSVGSIVSATIHVGSNAYPFSVTATSGDTLQTLVNSFIAQINASTALQGYGITGNQGNPTVMAFSFLCRRNGTQLPSITVSASGTITASITSQPADVLDAGPIWYLGRSTSQPAKAGDNVGEVPFNGGSATNPALVVTYAMLQGEVANPNIGSGLQGRFHFNTAGDFQAGGNLKRRMTLERGLQLYDSSSVAPAGGDKGDGTINAKGVFIDGVSVFDRSSFVASMSGAQTGIPAGTITKLNFTSLGANVGVAYDAINARWTPPAGMVRLSCSLLSLPAGSYVYIVKNGNLLRGSANNYVSALDYANGADYYDCRVLLSNSGSLDGQALYSWFEGEQI